MAHSPSTELSPDARRALLLLARQAITVELGVGAQQEPEEPCPTLAISRGVFVTLTLGGVLRGCIGTLENDTPLLQIVPDCARGAAFRDPRFPPLDHAELNAVQVEISVLTEPEPLAVASREQLLGLLRPTVDGLLIEESNRRATFLPQVWEQLGQPEQFLSHLLIKAGLPGDYWSEQLRCSRYQCIKFSETDQPPA
jgi:AmmeMemoRadiSam system protein A